MTEQEFRSLKTHRPRRPFSIRLGLEVSYFRNGRYYLVVGTNPLFFIMGSKFMKPIVFSISLLLTSALLSEAGAQTSFAQAQKLSQQSGKPMFIMLGRDG